MTSDRMKKVRFNLQSSQNEGFEAEERSLALVEQAELSKHTDSDDCWIAIHGKIYNVSGYLKKHPGGAQVILKLAGKDATVQFDEVGHSLESLMFDLGPKACVGALIPALKSSNPHASDQRLDHKQNSISTETYSEKSDRGWQKSDIKFSGLAHPHETILRQNPKNYEPKQDFEELSKPHKITSTIAALATIAFCIILLLYVKLRCANMIDHVVGFALPDEHADDNYEIPNWY
ncbi:LAFA_0A06304g1_1 [Lachancea sp. 'fantastica']|nr:LAFA_0A06304g1_1 [Lachancea sp. 'fantastica']